MESLQVPAVKVRWRLVWSTTRLCFSANCLPVPRPNTVVFFSSSSSFSWKTPSSAHASAGRVRAATPGRCALTAAKIPSARPPLAFSFCRTFHATVHAPGSASRVRASPLGLDDLSHSLITIVGGAVRYARLWLTGLRYPPYPTPLLPLSLLFRCFRNSRTGRHL